ncbi:DNA-binding GntR family transcriptional regulator [Arthrobacter ginsengisoli]|uniref:DNA-binding GntR family transcriptional regulator n=1 Tax=Arthrobacter ginsengisoli TaxID=1356565 RepID=A0ABU1UDM0_9MICC|nr:GntR family transcriptional regulator [Arthrobacter ginsengisoli]MDR7083307.1 DNA-binding GntR family transcriptional regulator [Arthrobacter ginsengisoli]
MARRANAETISEGVREMLRADIFAAQWAPGTNLQIGELTKRYAASSTVVREAMVRLAGEKLLQFRPNRGFFISEYSLEELRGLGGLRCRVEEYGLTLAIERGDVDWESDLVALHHRLERTPRRDSEDPHHITAEWFVAHQGFHAKLLEACGVPLLQDFAATLGEATALYRLWTAPDQRAQSRDIEAEHRAILEATIARDAPTATKLLREHYMRTIDIIEDAEFRAASEAAPSQE